MRLINKADESVHRGKDLEKWFRLGEHERFFFSS